MAWYSRLVLTAELVLELGQPALEDGGVLFERRGAPLVVLQALPCGLDHARSASSRRASASARR